jgi:chromosome segregation ATPase
MNDNKDYRTNTTSSSYNQSPFFSSNTNFSKPNFNSAQFSGAGQFSGSLSQSINDHETEQEAINMIRSQNRKIQELYEELEQRDQTIQTLQSQTSSNDNYKIQAENYKRQVSILEEKLRLYETDLSSKSSFLSEQLKHVSEAESKLRNQIMSKDKIIHDYDLALKDHEKQISYLKKQLVDKDGIYSDLKQDFNEITAKFKNLTLKLNLKEEEYKKYKDDQDIKFSEISKEKNLLEEKLSQLIDIVKQYSKELSEYNVQIQALETERRSMQKINTKLNEELEENLQKIISLENQINIMKEMKIQLQDAENVIHRLESLIDNEKLKNENLSKNYQEINSKYFILKEKYSGENSLENLKNQITTKINENENLNLQINNLTKSSKFQENKIQSLETENKEIISAMNNEFKSLIKWIETYMPVFYDQHFEIPDLPVTINKNIKNKFKLDSLKEILQKVRKNVNTEFNKYEQILKDAKKENNEIIHKQEKLIREISELKNQILNKNEEIFSLNSEIESYHSSLNQNKGDLMKIKSEVSDKQENFNRFLEKIYNNIQKEIDAILHNDTMKNFYEYLYRNNNYNSLTENNLSLKSQVEDNLEKILQILNSLIREYEIQLNKINDINSQKSENEKIKKEFSEKNNKLLKDIETLKSEKEEIIKNFEKIKIDDIRANESNLTKHTEKLRLKINEKEDVIIHLQQENNLLKSQIELIEKNINNNSLKSQMEYDMKENYEKLSDAYASLEKKLRNLTTEIELKDMQIKSQEQMINRRTQEISEMKGKLSSFNEGNVDFEKEKIKNLETDKEKLLKDNLALMNANYVLNNQIGLMKNELQVNYVNYLNYVIFLKIYILF